MTAGSGVTHTERTPLEDRNGKVTTVHGYQIWIALPKALEEMDPEFHHIPEEELPQWEEEGTLYTLVAGEGFGKKAPVPVHSPLFMVDVRSLHEKELNIQKQLEGEIGICIVDGAVTACGEKVEKGNMLVSKVEDTCQLVIHPNTHLLLFGGKPFEEERFIHWNFVSSSKERIEKAKADWNNKRFPKVKDDTTYVPMP